MVGFFKQQHTEIEQEDSFYFNFASPAIHVIAIERLIRNRIMQTVITYTQPGYPDMQEYLLQLTKQQHEVFVAEYKEYLKNNPPQPKKEQEADE